MLVDVPLRVLLVLSIEVPVRTRPDGEREPIAPRTDRRPELQHAAVAVMIRQVTLVQIAERCIQMCEQSLAILQPPGIGAGSVIVGVGYSGKQRELFSRGRAAPARLREEAGENARTRRVAPCPGTGSPANAARHGRCRAVCFGDLGRSRHAEVTVLVFHYGRRRL